MYQGAFQLVKNIEIPGMSGTKTGHHLINLVSVVFNLMEIGFVKQTKAPIIPSAEKSQPPISHATMNTKYVGH